MKLKIRTAKWVAAIGILCVLGGAVWLRARTTDRVTLDVRNMEVRKVARLMERQTGQPIVVQSNVTGTVTLNARNLPLKKALEIVGEQTSARVGSIYPLYSTRTSLAKLKDVLTGRATSATGWTNVLSNGMHFGFGPGMGPRPERALGKASEDTISLNITFEELTFAALAFSRLTPARVVVEDNATNRVSVALKNTPVEPAVGALAKKAGKQYTRLFVLAGRPGRGPGMANRQPGELTDEEAAQRETLNAELLATLPAEERERREKAEEERQKRMEEFKNMTAEQRMQNRAQMQPPGGGSQRMIERLKESTPEQRAAQRQQMAQARANGGGRGGFPRVTRN
jgi:hypothetical protein